MYRYTRHDNGFTVSSHGLELGIRVEKSENFTIFLPALDDDVPHVLLIHASAELNPTLEGKIARALLDAWTEGYATRDQEQERIES